jgi:glycosyltransferase involved in cell wall biosynthesis
VIHGHSSKGGACARLAAMGTRTPVFYTMHGLTTMDRSLSWMKRAVYHLIEFGLSLRTRGIVAVSPEERRQAVRAGLGRSRVRLAPNGVGPFDGVPRDEARRAIGCDEDAVVFGFVGRLVPQKAPDVLLEAFARVVAVAPHARLAIVGDGPVVTLLRELSRRLGVAEKVFLLGERDARGVLAGFDVFAMASRKEGLPYVVLEALAAGLPVVATEGCGVEILVDPGVNGAVVPNDDVAGLADAMTMLALDADLRARSGRASLRMAERFTLDAMVERTLRVYAGEEMAEAEPSGRATSMRRSSAVEFVAPMEVSA